MLEFDLASRCVSMPGKHGKVISPAIEDVCHAIFLKNILGMAVQEAIDKYDRSLEGSVASDDDEHMRQESSLFHRPVSETDEHDISGVNETEGTKGTDDGTVLPPYLGIEDLVNIPDSDYLPANEIKVLPGEEIPFFEQQYLRKYYQRLRFKEFLGYRVEGLPNSVLQTLSNLKNQFFYKPLTKLHVSREPHNSNVISSNVLYKILRCVMMQITCKKLELRRMEIRIESTPSPKPILLPAFWHSYSTIYMQDLLLVFEQE